MATTTEPPRPDTLTTSILDRLPDDLVARLAALEPEAVAALAEAMRRESRRRAILQNIPPGGPLPDEPEFNEETRQVLQDMRDGKNVTRYENADDFYAAHGF